MSQGDVQGSVRSYTGTAYSYEGDWHALFDLASIQAGAFNGRLLAYINNDLGTSYADLNGAMAAYAASLGAPTWGGLGSTRPALPSGFSFLTDPSDGSYLIDPSDGTYLIG